MGVGIDESGCYYVCQGQQRYGRPHDSLEACRAAARKQGLGVDLVRLAGRAVATPPPARPDVQAFIAAVSEVGEALEVLAVLAQGARDAAAAIKAADYTDEQRAALAVEERRKDRPRVTVLRALGVEV